MMVKNVIFRILSWIVESRVKAIVLITVESTPADARAHPMHLPRAYPPAHFVIDRPTAKPDDPEHPHIW